MLDSDNYGLDDRLEPQPTIMLEPSINLLLPNLLDLLIGIIATHDYYGEITKAPSLQIILRSLLQEGGDYVGVHHS